VAGAKLAVRATLLWWRVKTILLFAPALPGFRWYLAPRHAGQSVGWQMQAYRIVTAVELAQATGFFFADFPAYHGFAQA